MSNDSTISISERSPPELLLLSISLPQKVSLPVAQRQRDPSEGSRLPWHLPWDRQDLHTLPTPDLIFQTDGLSTVIV